jgi:hypothetical protein
MSYSVFIHSQKIKYRTKERLTGGVEGVSHSEQLHYQLISKSQDQLDIERRQT